MAVGHSLLAIQNLAKYLFDLRDLDEDCGLTPSAERELAEMAARFATFRERAVRKIHKDGRSYTDIANTVLSTTQQVIDIAEPNGL